MGNKPGERFTDKKGKNFVLGTDPKGGHTRPYAAGKQPGKGCAAVILVAIGALAATAAAIGAVMR